MIKFISILLGKTIIMLLRSVGSAGSALPGLIIEKIYPNFVGNMVKDLKGVIIVTGTNGKTTTTKMLYTILSDLNTKPITNRSGSNMSRGIASTLIEQSSWSGKIRGEYGLFEVDEAFVGDVSRKTLPAVIIVLNLLRDQLDRYGELDRTAEFISNGFQYAQNVILNSDDPLVANLSAGLDKRNVLFFGASAPIRKLLPHDEILHNSQAQKSSSSKMKPDVILLRSHAYNHKQTIEIEHNGQKYSSELNLLGVFNSYNALAAFSVASVLHLDQFSVARSLSSVQAAFGRGEIVNVDGKTFKILLVKNPSGFNQIIKTFLATNKKLYILMALNDNIADGRDVSWIWDVDFESLSTFSHHIYTTGFRAYDLANRLKYADIQAEAILDPAEALRIVLNRIPAGEIGYVIPTYTAMLQLRALLGRKTSMENIWE